MSDYVHIPVMVEEVSAALRPKPGGRYFDGTVGGGGHAAVILERSAPTGRLFGCDRDGAAVEAATARLAAFAGRFDIRRAPFSAAGEGIERGSLDGALLDLGVSSPQLDQAERGFSFQADGPLDMRMDRSQGVTAANLLAAASADELAKIFWELGEEREARRLARAIEEERRRCALETTGQLARLIERLKPRHGQRLHPATKVFQALRMAVNDELGELERGLDAVWSCLRTGGRLAVIAFHSGEDRVVKNFGRRLARPYVFPGEVDAPMLRQPRDPELLIVERKAVMPGAEEQAANPRARSARLRVYERLRDA